MNVTILTFDTANYRFQVVAADEPTARKLLNTAWRKHARQTGATLDYLRENVDDINVVTVPLGTVLRDGGPLN